jgi:hypothetical protein
VLGVSLVMSWLVFPGLLLLLVLGCGSLVEHASGLRLPGALIPPLGFATVVVASNFTTWTGATARLTTPLVIALATAGLALAVGRLTPKIDGWAVLAAAGVFAAYAAPVVLSGAATFAGYITLDDTSTWLALADRAMEHGRSVSDLPPSTYSTVLNDYFSTGYPLGAFLPMGIGGELTGEDTAWLFQPTIAFAAAMVALSIYEATSPLVSSRALRAGVAFLGAQPALLFAYAYWSGIKEVAASAMIALLTALVAMTVSRWNTVRAHLPVAMVLAGLFAVLGLAGGVWLVAPSLILGALLLRRGWSGARSIGIAAALTALLALPSLAIARSFISGASGAEITTETEVANLGHPLDKLQLLGIWPTIDFRLRPGREDAAYVLMAIVALAAIGAVIVAFKRRRWALPLYLVTCLLGVGLLYALERFGLSSPWLNAKGLATASPAVVALAAAGGMVVFEAGRRVEAAVLLAAIAGGVLWSNVLTYRGVWLAPREQLAELETIGERFAAQGPTLVTDPEPYAARHFLRRMAPEGPSERRRRPVNLRNGGILDKGEYADLDQFALDSILVYRTLVLRRSPWESRPPSPYRLVSRDRWFEVWQRDAAEPRIVEHVPFGADRVAAARAPCQTVLDLAARATSSGGRLATVLRSTPQAIDITRSTYPPGWVPGQVLGSLVPSADGVLVAELTVPTRGGYEIWIGGSLRKGARVAIDNVPLGGVDPSLNGGPFAIPVGRIQLERGPHLLELAYGGSKLEPGSGGFPFALGPLVLATETAADVHVTYLEPSAARSLCGRRVDWIEVVPR